MDRAGSTGRIARRIAVLAAAALLSPPAAWAGEAVVSRAVDGFVRPAYAELEKAAATLSGRMSDLCEAPSEAALEQARAAFADAVPSWSRVETIRFGPVTEENRLERFLFWPDRKGIGLRQVQAALATEDATASDPQGLTHKSVAVQGFGALEFVLYGTGAETLSGRGAAYRCAFGKAIAGNLAAMAAIVAADWQKPDDIAAIWEEPGPDNPLYRTPDEARTELLDVFIQGLEMTRDVKVNGFLGQTPGDDKPKSAIYWRSGQTVAALDAALQGMKSLFDAADVAALLPDDRKRIAISIEAGFDKAHAALAGLDGPVADLLSGPASREKLVAFRAATSELSRLFGTELTAALGLTAGFSSLDGD